jgi:hypothetical protein
MHDDAKMIKLKTISYLEGLVRFRIPESWAEHYAPESGAAFYSDNPDSGILRLDVITAVAKRQIDAGEAQRRLSADAKKKGYDYCTRMETLRFLTGNSIRRSPRLLQRSFGT